MCSGTSLTAFAVKCPSGIVVQVTQGEMSWWVCGPGDPGWDVLVGLWSRWPRVRCPGGIVVQVTQGEMSWWHWGPGDPGWDLTALPWGHLSPGASVWELHCHRKWPTGTLPTWVQGLVFSSLSEKTGLQVPGPVGASLEHVEKRQLLPTGYVTEYVAWSHWLYLPAVRQSWKLGGKNPTLVKHTPVSCSEGS